MRQRVHQMQQPILAQHPNQTMRINRGQPQLNWSRYIQRRRNPIRRSVSKYKRIIKFWSTHEIVHMWWVYTSLVAPLFGKPWITLSSFLFQRAQTEAVTFLSNKESNRNLYAISGLDYVSQDDILPYASSARDRRPLRHELFDKFLTYVGSHGTGVTFKPTETLCTWQEKNHPWLELAEVHRETTQKIRVTVMPFYVSG